MYEMPCPFTGPKKFCASPNFVIQPENLTAFSTSSKTFVLAQRPISLNANHLFVWHKMFVTLNKFLVWHKKFGPAQNSLGPVKRQGINKKYPYYILRCMYVHMYASKRARSISIE